MAVSQVAALAFNSAGTLLASGSLDSKHIILLDRPTCDTADPEPCMQYISHCGIAFSDLLSMPCPVQQ